MDTQMFITSVVVQLLPQQLVISHLMPMLLCVIMCHFTAIAMLLKCLFNITPIGIQTVFKSRMMFK